MTGTNGIGLRGLLVLALVLGLTAHASAGHRPVEISGTLTVGETTVAPSGPLAKALEGCVGLDVTVTGESDPAGALAVRSIETPLPEGWPWLF